MLTLSIVQPCHEKWGNMTPDEQGAYCDSCCKNVIDFTGMSDNEIIDRLQENNSGHMCGRFRNDQLNRPLIEIAPSIFMMRIPFWKKFLAALFIYFSSFITGCTTGGDKDYTAAEVPQVDHTISEKNSLISTTIPEKIPTTDNSKPEDILIKHLNYKEQSSSLELVTMGLFSSEPSYPFTSPFPDLKIK